MFRVQGSGLQRHNTEGLDRPRRLQRGSGLVNGWDFNRQRETVEGDQQARPARGRVGVTKGVVKAERLDRK